MCIAPLGLWLTLDSDQFDRITFDRNRSEVEIRLAAADKYTPSALLRIELPARPGGAGEIEPQEKFESQQGAWVVLLTPSGTVLHLAIQSK